MIEKEIIKQIDNKIKEYPELKELQENTSKVSFWNSIKSIISFTVILFETIFKEHLKEVQKILNTKQIGSNEWYRDLSLNYQDGDSISIENNLVVYPINNDDKKIIKRVSVKENSKGGIKLKVSREDTESNKLKPLNNEELTRFRTFISRVKIAGIPVEIISINPDKLKLDIELELDSLVFDEQGKTIDGENKIENTINNYLNNYPFDKSFYLSKLIDELQEIKGVKDVFINDVLLNNDIIKRKIEEVPAGYMILDKENSKFKYVLN